MTNAINNKFYDFINMYNAIIRHCSNKNRYYDVKLYHINDTLYFKVTDKESNVILHNDGVVCSKEESKLLLNMITSEFILNHKLKYAAFSPMTNKDIVLFLRGSNDNQNITSNQFDYFNDGKAMKIHCLENSIFTLSIYHYEGVEQTEILHQMANNKASRSNKEEYTLKK